MIPRTAAPRCSALCIENTANSSNSPSYAHCRKKFEIATDEVGNFIKQDEKKGVLREVSANLISAIHHSHHHVFVRLALILYPYVNVFNLCCSSKRVTSSSTMDVFQ